MQVEVRACASIEEFRAATVPMGRYLGFALTEEEATKSWGRVLPPEHVHAAYVGEGVVGGVAALPMRLTVPGGRVDAAGVTMVAVLPTHRRRGVLTGLMRAQLDASHARGEPLAYLWASEDTIYGRFGYGVAGLMAEFDLARDRARFVSDVTPRGEIRLVPLADAEPFVAPVYESVAAATPGMFARSSDWWQTRILVDPDWRRRGGGGQQCAVLLQDGGPTAYAFYRLNIMFERGINNGNISVIEAMGRSAEATQAIWRYICDIDWLARVKAWTVPLDHPLLLLLAEPRRLNMTVRDGVWVRLVDVGAALKARGYAGEGAVVIEVADAFCPWNAGRWSIGTTGVKRTRAAADLACDVSVLASAYLGGFSWARLAAGLRVRELRTGGVERADALFRTARAPWCPEIF